MIDSCMCVCKVEVKQFVMQNNEMYVKKIQKYKVF